MPGKALLDTVPPLDGPPDLETLLTRVPVAVLLGFVVAAVYHAAHGRQGVPNTLRTTLVLLCVLVALVTIVIGNNLARAFGLVGALSIVRFRTVVADTRDTAFVIFAVVVGMAAGAGYLVLAAVAIPAILLAAMAMTLFDGRQGGVAATLAVKFALEARPDEVMAALFAKYGLTAELSAAGSAKQGAAVEHRYRVRLPSASVIANLAAELHRTEGVQGVEVKAKDDE